MRVIVALGHCPRGNCNPCSCLETRLFKSRLLKSLFSHVLNYKSWLKLIYDKITYICLVINEFHPTFEVQNIGNEAFQNGWFATMNDGCSCLWDMFQLRNRVETCIRKQTLILHYFLRKLAYVCMYFCDKLLVKILMARATCTMHFLVSSASKSLRT